MTDRELIKNYKETYRAVAKKPTEKAKRIYVNAFNAFDKKLNKDLESYLQKLNVKARSIDEELVRIKKVLNALEYRIDVRKKMLKDYKSILGYKPKKLPKIYLEDEFDGLKITYNNLSRAKDIIRDLIISGKEIRRIKRNNSRFKNQDVVQRKIDKLIKKRVQLIDMLKNAPDIMDDLYDFAIKAPFNEVNGYINYLIVKSDPKGRLKKGE